MTPSLNIVPSLSKLQMSLDAPQKTNFNHLMASGFPGIKPYAEITGFVPGNIIFKKIGLSVEMDYRSALEVKGRVEKLQELLPTFKRFVISIPAPSSDARSNAKKAMISAANEFKQKYGYDLIILKTDNFGKIDAGRVGIGAMGSGNEVIVDQFDIYMQPDSSITQPQMQEFSNLVRNNLQVLNTGSGFKKITSDAASAGMLTISILSKIFDALNKLNPARGLTPSH